MRTTTKLLLLAIPVAAGIAYQRKHRLLRGATGAGARRSEAAQASSASAPDVVIVEAEIIGISDVDPPFM